MNLNHHINSKLRRTKELKAVLKFAESQNISTIAGDFNFAIDVPGK